MPLARPALPVFVVLLFARGLSASDFQWTSGGPPAPAVSVMAADPFDSNTLYAGGGTIVYRSVNDGKDWESIGPQISFSVAALVPDPLHPGAIFIGANGPGVIGTWQGKGEIWKTSDAGAAWERIYNYGWLGSLDVDPHAPETLVLSSTCTNVDLLPCQPPVRSADGGQSFQQFGSVPPGLVKQFLFDPWIPGTIYALCRHLCSSCPRVEMTVFKTVDGGASWSIASSGLPLATTFLLSDSISRLTSSRSENETIYAATRAGLFRSTDGGASWKPTGLSENVQDVAIHPWDPKVLFAATESSGVLLSIDRGATWQPINDGLRDLNVKAILVDAGGVFLHALTRAVYDLKLPRPVLRASTGPRAGRVIPAR